MKTLICISLALVAGRLCAIELILPPGTSEQELAFVQKLEHAIVTGNASEFAALLHHPRPYNFESLSRAFDHTLSKGVYAIALEHVYPSEHQTIRGVRRTFSLPVLWKVHLRRAPNGHTTFWATVADNRVAIIFPTGENVGVRLPGRGKRSQ